MPTRVLRPDELTPADTRNLLYASISERDWQTQVRAWCNFGDWQSYVTWTSVHSPSGYPDLTLCHPRRRLLAFIELKTERGKLRPQQRHWQDVLGVMRSPHIAVAVWRPNQGDQVKNYLLLDGVDPPPSQPKPRPAISVRRRSGSR